MDWWQSVGLVVLFFIEKNNIAKCFDAVVSDLEMLSQKQKELEEENQNLRDEVESLLDKVNDLAHRREPYFD